MSEDMVIETDPEVIEYHAIRGSYGKTTYFMTKASLRDVAENLELAPQGTLNFKERIQRIVNENRVEDEILPYLEHNELKFFNSIVCILLPDSENQQEYWAFEEFKTGAGLLLGGLGKLKLTKNVARVVLDGQHRYSALKRYWRKYNGDMFNKVEAIEVALIFVVIDDIGKKGTAHEHVRSTTISAVRNLFAVLNKTARSVDSSTLLLIDDSIITNIVTRRFIEEGLIEEKYIKWTGGQNLTLSDPYFTSLHVINDIVCFWLRDDEKAQKEYGEKEERDIIVNDVYANTSNTEISLRDAIPRIITETEPFMQWTNFINEQGIVIKLQPESSLTTHSQRREIKNKRTEQLYFTVAGQRALYQAIASRFIRSKRTDLQTLSSIIENVNRLLLADCFQRTCKDDNPFYGLLFDGKNRMIHVNSSVKCSRLILSVALGENLAKEKIKTSYQELTGKQPEILEEYWKRVISVLTEN